MNNRVFGFCLLLFLILSEGMVTGQVSVYPDAAVRSVMDKQKSVSNNLNGKSVGYRVQIFFSSGNNSREEAYRIRNEFISKYPKVSVYVTFKEPNFRVIVGDFRTRAEAVGFMREIAEFFPQSFVLRDDIEYVKHDYAHE